MPWPSRSLTLSHRFTRSLLSLTVGLAAFVWTPSIAAAQSDGNGLSESSTTTFSVDSESGTVRVTIEVSLRNVTSDRRDGDIIRQTYFSGYGVVLPIGAENVVATSNGSVLSGERIEENPDDPFFLYSFDLARNLFNGQSAAITVTYDHTGQPPRSELLWRANAAYASFLAYGPGDSESVTIRIVLPEGYEFDEFTDLTGFEASDPDEFGAVVHTRSELSEDFAAVVSLSNDDLLTSIQLDVPGADLELRAWPDDPEWAAFATEKVESGVPELEALIGSPWPLDEAFDIRQTVEPNFLGYAGWFDTRASEIAVGEELDANTLYHELSHAWFNRDVFGSRWLSEGLAELYAAEMVERDGDPRPEADTPALTGLGRQPLAQWTDFSADDDTEAYGYNAAHFVMDAVADDIGFEAMADVLEAVRERPIAYPSTGRVGPGEQNEVDLAESRASTTIDWRVMLDYFEFVGGSTTADGVFREYVVPDGELDELDERSTAIQRYNDLVDRVAPWSMPVGLRAAMDRWSFERAADLRDDADDVIGLRSDVERLATSTGIEPTAAVMATAARAFAETDDDFDEVTSLLGDEIASAEELVERQQTVEEQSILAAASPPQLSTLADLDGFASAFPVVDDQIDALDALLEAIAAEAAPRSFVENIGLRGSDVDADVDAARSAVEAGDTDTARARAANAVQTLDDAGDVGARRLTIAGAALAGLLVFVIAVVVLRRRSKHRRAADEARAARDSGGSGVGLVAGEFGDRHIDLDEDALARAGLGGVDDVGDVAVADPGETAGATGIVERSAVLGDVGDAIFELDEHVGTVIDADPVTGAEVLVDPHTHDEGER